jgi:hypothetical protein
MQQLAQIHKQNNWYWYTCDGTASTDTQSKQLVLIHMLSNSQHRYTSKTTGTDTHAMQQLAQVHKQNNWY